MNMTKITDILGEYEPIINCNCIDSRTKANLDEIFKDAIHDQYIIRSDKNKPADLRKAADRNIATILDFKEMFNKIKKC
jgi:hypothetical protein